ncbi:hypothetical protein AJ80_03359 [Polytolypa hystricis UAMH7299]|uniref:Ubiquitin-like domain-containing protein n=1 Tax=Polytolypa hystricis (strain UAMH7299) TaxID=1447883 RepID=A0A2B7YJS9_POLH7|nr:hypothetical protein AJ80_03359 [Polytolypa hystricis UAMH7299]
MTELSFAKSFLSTLDSLPVKLPSDYVADPREFTIRHAFTLPRLSDPPHPPMPKKTKTATIPGSSKSIKIHLKSSRNPELHITLPNVALSTTTIQELREAVQERTETTASSSGGQSSKVPLEKIKILWKRKPVQAKTVAEVLRDEASLQTGGREAEFGVMIIGGATAVAALVKQDQEMRDVEATTGLDAAAQAKEEQPGRRELAAEQVLSGDQFWDELGSFLQEKIKDEKEAARVEGLFRKGWESR